MGRVKIGDVAREAGVSLGTVSNALNHPDRVRPDKLAAINEAIQRLGYIPNQAARQLAGTPSKVFGLALPRLDHAFSLQIANGAEDECREQGYDLLIASAGNDDLLESQHMHYFLGAHIAGVLVQPMAGLLWEPPVKNPPLPTVYLDVHCEGAGTCVAADNEAQGQIMLEHALACGARKVAVVGEAVFMQLDYRVRGILSAVEGSGATIEIFGRGKWNAHEDGREIGCELARREPERRPEFVIALTDVLAAGVIEGLSDSGVSIPNDMLVAGCDGNPLAWGGQVPLTTIESPGYEIGRAGVRLLLAQITGAASACERNPLIAPTLRVRASTSRN